MLKSHKRYNWNSPATAICFDVALFLLKLPLWTFTYYILCIFIDFGDATEQIIYKIGLQKIITFISSTLQIK